MHFHCQVKDWKGGGTFGSVSTNVFLLAGKHGGMIFEQPSSNQVVNANGILVGYAIRKAAICTRTKEMIREGMLDVNGVLEYRWAEVLIALYNKEFVLVLKVFQGDVLMA